MENELNQDYEEKKKELDFEYIITDEDVKKFFENIESKKKNRYKRF